MSLNCESCGVAVDHREPGTLIAYNEAGGERKAYCVDHAQRRPTRLRSIKRGRGWDLVHAIDKRWTDGQRSGRLLSWEAQRIRKGDFSPLIRELEPEMDEGKTIVVSWERSKPIVADDVTREIIHTEARPVLWVTITSKVRRAKGGWSIRFDINDLRERVEFMRRVPPAQGSDDATQDEAALASSYTTDARAAVEAVPIIPHEDLKRFAAEARVASLLQDAGATEERLERIGGLPARERMAALHKLASDRGVDVRDDVRAFERRVMRRLGKAA